MTLCHLPCFLQIFNYYDIIPANNTNPDATLRVRYFDGELNGLSENSLVFFESQNTTNWTGLGFSSRDAVANFVEENGINRFGRFTLSSAGNILPVRFVLLNAKCEENKVLITWKTAQEQNSSHFNVERSVDGARWAVIGNLPAAGNSTVEKSYSLTDNNPVQNGYYRIAEHDLDGKVQYSPALRSSCNAAGEVLTLWPNPVRDRLFINIVTSVASQAIIKVFDTKGALVAVKKVTVLQGSNQLNIDMGSLSNGMYSVSVDWNNGQMKKSVQVLKQ